MQKTTNFPSSEPATLGKMISLAAGGMLLLIIYTLYQIGALFWASELMTEIIAGKMPVLDRILCISVFAGATAVSASALRAALMIWTFRRNAAKAAIQHYLLLIAFSIEQMVVTILLDSYFGENLSAEAIGSFILISLYEDSGSYFSAHHKERNESLFANILKRSKKQLQKAEKLRYALPDPETAGSRPPWHHV